jgi:4-hydroxy-3-polyprenylbenzoate decarboxylase
MAYASLREFIHRLEGGGRLVRVTARVSPKLEITEIHTRLLAERQSGRGRPFTWPA